MLHFTGHGDFRQRIVLATLTRTSIRINEIRPAGDEVGLCDFEASFLRLVEKVVDGSEIFVNETGTAMQYRPGMIVGGRNVVHDCGHVRGLGYFIEPLLAIALFAKRPLTITLRGLTNVERDIGVDVLRSVTMPLLKRFGLEDELHLQIVRRGAPPAGVGEVVLTIPVVRSLQPLHLTDPGRVKRVRGVAYGTKVSPQIINRVVDAARGILTNYIPDVWIYTDVHAAKEGSAGYALSFVAESNNGCLISAEATASPGLSPEDVGRAAASQLLEEILQGGVVDSTHQPLAMLLMTFGQQDVSRLRTGSLSVPAISLLRNLRVFLGVKFQMWAQADDNSTILACRGVGFSNASKGSM